jgi:hypothetical protein
MNFFGTKKVDPIEQAKEWKRNLAKEARKLDRDILALQRAEKRAMKECKVYAKKVRQRERERERKRKRDELLLLTNEMSSYLG